MPLACAAGLYLKGERGSRRKKGLRKLGRNRALPIGQQPFLPTSDSRTRIGWLGWRVTGLNGFNALLQRVNYIVVHPAHCLAAIVDAQVAKMSAMVGVIQANDLRVKVNSFEAVCGDYRIVTINKNGGWGADVFEPLVGTGHVVVMIYITEAA